MEEEYQQPQSGGISKKTIIIGAIALGGVVGLIMLMNRKNSSPASTDESGTAYTASDLSVMSLANQLSQFRGEFQEANADSTNLIKGGFDANAKGFDNLTAANKAGIDSLSAAIAANQTSTAGSFANILSMLGLIQGGVSNNGAVLSNINQNSGYTLEGLNRLWGLVNDRTTGLQAANWELFQLAASIPGANPSAALGNNPFLSASANVLGEAPPNRSTQGNRYMIYGESSPTGGYDAGTGNGSEWYSLRIPERRAS